MCENKIIEGHHNNVPQFYNQILEKCIRSIGYLFFWCAYYTSRQDDQTHNIETYINGIQSCIKDVNIKYPIVKEYIDEDKYKQAIEFAKLYNKQLCSIFKYPFIKDTIGARLDILMMDYELESLEGFDKFIEYLNQEFDEFLFKYGTNKTRRYLIQTRNL